VLENAVRQAISRTFFDADERFTYKGILKARLIFGLIDRRFGEDETAEAMSTSIETLRHVTGIDLYGLPKVQSLVTSYALRVTMRGPLGSVALAWQIICNGTMILTKEGLLTF
jgi:hypothetical protein